MKRLLLLLLLTMTLSVTACAQDRYDSPQTVTWDAPVLSADYTITGYDVAVLHKFADRDDPAVYMTIGTAPAEMLIDLETAGIYGVFIVAVRTTYVYDSEPLISGWAYSDVVEDIDTVTFYLVNHPIGKPRLIRIK